MNHSFLKSVFALGTMTLLATSTLHGDEGMWLFNDPPRNLLKTQHGFEITDAWLEHVQRSSVRFNSGGSGSFVSADGLVMSNHHVGADSIQKLSDKDHDYLRDGFHAKTRAEEKRCLDLELNVLISIEDVTDRVNAAVRPDLPPEQAFRARSAVIEEIQKESLDRTGLRSDVVTLYQGGKYHLHRFKKYTDVRLVFAPEQQIAFFGGDPDNFEYPRFALDVCFFRAYENGQPARVEHYLRWSQAGADENELVFVSGHPGRTSRLLTLTELEYARDRQLPFRLRQLYRLEVLLAAYSARSAENERRAKDDLFGVQNSRKALKGRLAGLLDPTLMARKAEEEKILRDAVAREPGLRSIAEAWQKIDAAQAVIADTAQNYNLFEAGAGFRSELFGIARTLLRAADERALPNRDRLREFTDSGRESLEFQLFSEKPIHDDLEILTLADSLTFLTELLGAGDELVRTILAGRSPEQRAVELVTGTKVGNVPFRRLLYREGAEAVRAAQDPMIELARLIDGPARAWRKTIEAQSEIKQQAHAQIGRARFAVHGTSIYPDATFTLRLAFGPVKGYADARGDAPFQTTFAGLYQRAEEQRFKPPFDLPELWLKRKRSLNLATPFNFVCTADIIGGNSGSPVINRNAEVVGLIFDGNIQSLVLDYAYSDEQARATSVHSRAIVEALRKVYRATRLADELVGRN